MDRLPPLPARPADAHKGDFGRVLIVAGSRGMSGAAVLAATGAYRGGAGLVTLAVPEEIVDTVAAAQVCAIVRPLPLRELDANVLAIGPGLGMAPATVFMVRDLAGRATMPMVVDADGLNAFVEVPNRLAGSKAPRILTPHPGELARLTGLTPEAIQKERRGTSETAARLFKSIIVLKGQGTVVTDGKQTWICETGNAGMATGGTGDVLTGLIAALVGQKMNPFEAVCLGVHLHGLAGDLAAKKLGQHSLMATDLLEYLPVAFLAHERSTG